MREKMETIEKSSSCCPKCHTPYTKRRPNSCQKCYFEKRHKERYIPKSKACENCGVPSILKRHKLCEKCKDNITVNEDPSKYRIYFGRKFYKATNDYWVCTTARMPQAHRWIWMNTYGEIPKGMHIHHIDGNKDNNDISNLQMLSGSDHLLLHWNENLFENKDPNFEKRKKQLEVARQWLYTPEGRKRQSEKAKDGWASRKSFQKCCPVCNELYSTYMSYSRYCSDSCRQSWKRKHKIYSIEEICPICNNLFQKDKFSSKRFCSVSCGAKNSANLRGIKRLEKVC